MFMAISALLKSGLGFAAAHFYDRLVTDLR
jgi:hypothetical protein